MATGSETNLRDLYNAKQAAAQQLQETNKAFMADLPQGRMRVVHDDGGTVIFYREKNGKLVEITDVEVLDFRTPSAPGAATLP